MFTTTRRRAAGAAALLVAPALIAIGTATMSHAEVSVVNTGPTFSQPVQHPAFPQQYNTPVPGTSIHHHHQR
jgi:hypothetical protein